MGGTGREQGRELDHDQPVGLCADSGTQRDRAGSSLVVAASEALSQSDAILTSGAASSTEYEDTRR